jgi:hypothetical protein
MEIGIQGWEGSGFFFGPPAIQWFDRLAALGYRIAALGGSDDHKGGNNTMIHHPSSKGHRDAPPPTQMADIDIDAFPDFTWSPIGNPTTMVFARDLSVASIVDGIRNGRTVVKMHSPADPMLALDVAPVSLPIGSDTLIVNELSDELRMTFSSNGQIKYTATVTSVGTFKDLKLRLIHNGVATSFTSVTSDPFTMTWTVPTPLPGTTDRARAELYSGDHTPRTLTSHVWIKA